jgi:hypothetical protein
MLYVSPEGRLCRWASFLVEEGGDGSQAASTPSARPGKGFLLSALAPGAGQWFQGQGRWPAYAAIEIWAWFQFLDLRREGRDLRSDYRDLAWFVARRVSTGPRTEAGWDYYEALSEYRSSGAYDVDPEAPGVQPETDPETFNGSIWALAREIYLPEDPENPVPEGSEPYLRAQEYYQQRAYEPRLAWDWGTNLLHQQEYGSLIRKADEALRSSTGMVGIILANHLLSAVDAFVSGRLRAAGLEESSLRLTLAPGHLNPRDVAIQVRIADPFPHVY